MLISFIISLIFIFVLVGFAFPDEEMIVGFDDYSDTFRGNVITSEMKYYAFSGLVG